MIKKYEGCGRLEDDFDWCFVVGRREAKQAGGGWGGQTGWELDVGPQNIGVSRCLRGP